MEEALHKIVENDPEMIIPIILFVIMGVVAIIGIVFGVVSSTLGTKERERSRREIAAYIAEGSMTPEDGERLIRAGGANGKSKKKGSCWF